MNSARYCKELPLAPGYFYQQAEAARKFSPQMDIDSSVSTSISETSALSAPIWDSAFAKLSAACDSLAARTNPPRHVYVDQFGGQPGACDRLASCAVSAMPAPGPKVPEPLRYVMAIKIYQRGVQWKQGVVIYMLLYTSLLCTTTPIHCTPLPLHPPL